MSTILALTCVEKYDCIGTKTSTLCEYRFAFFAMEDRILMAGLAAVNFN